MPLAQPDQRMEEEHGPHDERQQAPEQIATPDMGQFMPQHHRLFRGTQADQAFRVGITMAGRKMPMSMGLPLPATRNQFGSLVSRNSLRLDCQLFDRAA